MKIKDSDTKIVFIDTLTTGMNVYKCGIYAIGGIICKDTLEGTIEQERFEMRIRPFDGAYVKPASLWIGGIQNRELYRFKNETESLAWLTHILEKHITASNPKDKAYLAGYNASAFDVPFLRQFFRRNKNDNFYNYFQMQTIDIMSLAAFALMRERRGMIDFQLDTTARKLGVEPETSERYNCLDNAKTCLDMYRILKEQLGQGVAGDTETTAETQRNYDPEQHKTHQTSNINEPQSW